MMIKVQRWAAVLGLCTAFGVAFTLSAAAAGHPIPKAIPIPRPKPSVLTPVALPGPAAAPAPAAAPKASAHAEPKAPPTAEALPEPTEPRIGDSGLPVPRFVSLKSGEVYLREGPSADHKVEWVYVRRGLPVEVIAEYDVWRRIKDSDGVVGWVHKGMLDGKRSVLITAGANVPLRESASPSAAVIAYAQPGVIAKLKMCSSGFCEVQAQSVEGYVSRDRLYGVYQGETVD